MSREDRGAWNNGQGGVFDSRHQAPARSTKKGDHLQMSRATSDMDALGHIRQSYSSPVAKGAKVLEQNACSFTYHQSIQVVELLSLYRDEQCRVFRSKTCAHGNSERREF